MGCASLLRGLDIKSRGRERKLLYPHYGLMISPRSGVFALQEIYQAAVVARVT